jgi:hypothetical protein
MDRGSRGLRVLRGSTVPASVLELPVVRPADGPLDGPPAFENPPLPEPIFSAGRIVTALLVVGPLVALAAFVPLEWGHLIGVGDIVVAAFFYLVTGLGIAVGFHRFFTHRSFKANRTLKVVLAVAGTRWPSRVRSSVGWRSTAATTCSATNREILIRPYRYGSGSNGTFKGFLSGPTSVGCSPPSPPTPSGSLPIFCATPTSSSSTGSSPYWPSARW